MATPPIEPYIDPEEDWRVYLQDGASNIDAIGDYSPTGLGETIFQATVTGGGTIVIVHVDMAMAYSSGFDVFNYGDIAGTAAVPALTTGIRLRIVMAGGGTKDLDAGVPIRDNFTWALLATRGGTLQPSESPGQNQDGFYGVRFDLDGISKPMALRAGDAVQVVLNDDFTSLLAHRFLVSGYRTNRYP